MVFRAVCVLFLLLSQAESCDKTIVEGAFKFLVLDRCYIPPPPPHEGMQCRMTTQPDFYFDSKTRSCVDASWSACMPRGEGNGFKTQEECEAQCIKEHAKMIDENGKLLSKNPICNLPADRGLCFAYLPSFYYDPEKGKCLEFIYGGCMGNENRFETVEDCEKICMN